MAWIFVSVLLITVVYLAVQFPAFRKAIGICLVLLCIAVAGLFYNGHIEDQKRQQRDQQREELSLRLIRPDDIEITNTVLGQSYGGWRIQGNVTNRSTHELEGFILKIVVQDCPVSGNPCTTIGEEYVSPDLSVPPNQMRSFDRYVSLRNMPTPAKLKWTYAVQKVRGKVK
jgi:hypothetical protein